MQRRIEKAEATSEWPLFLVSDCVGLFSSRWLELLLAASGQGLCIEFQLTIPFEYSLLTPIL
jgi:hypothetical protein